MAKWLYLWIPISSKLEHWNIGTGSDFFYLLTSSLTRLALLCVLVASFFVHDQSRPIYLGPAFVVLLIFSWLCVGVGLGYILRPEQLAYRQVTETCSRLVREISDQEILLDRIAHTLYTTLKPENLSVWRYHDEDSILTLLHFEGAILIDDLAELPLDIAAEQLHGTRFVPTLPESALRQALLAMEVQIVVSLSLGDELIGFIGLGNIGSRSEYNRKTLRWLNLMAGQLALIIKNTYLVSDLEEMVKKLQQAYRQTIDVKEE